MSRVVFMGTPAFACPSLKAIASEVVGVVSQPDRPAGRGMASRPTPVRMLAEELGIPLLQPEKVSSPEAMQWIRDLNPDVIAVVAFGQLLKSELLQLPRWGCVNVHASLLPRWRGASPIVASILAGDAASGVTTQKMVLALDAGEILLQRETPLTPDETMTSLTERLSHMGAELLAQTLEQLGQGKVVGRAQDLKQVTWAPKLSRDQQWLNAEMTVVEMDRRIRALNPWPGCRIRTEEGEIKILKAILEPHLDLGSSLERGCLFESRGVLYLSSGKDHEGSLRVLELQLEGKRAVTAGDFLNGLKNRTQKKLPWKF